MPFGYFTVADITSEYILLDDSVPVSCRKIIPTNAKLTDFIIGQRVRIGGPDERYHFTIYKENKNERKPKIQTQTLQNIFQKRSEGMDL